MVNSFILILCSGDGKYQEDDSNELIIPLERIKRTVMIVKSIQPLSFLWPLKRRCCCPPATGGETVTMAPAPPPPPPAMNGTGGETPPAPPAEGGAGGNMTAPLSSVEKEQLNEKPDISIVEEVVSTCQCNKNSIRKRRKNNRVQQVVSEKIVNRGMTKKRIMKNNHNSNSATRKLQPERVAVVATTKESVRENNNVKQQKSSKFMMRRIPSLSRRVAMSSNTFPYPISPSFPSSSPPPRPSGSRRGVQVTRSMVKTFNSGSKPAKMRKMMMVSGTGTTDTPRKNIVSRSSSPSSVKIEQPKERMKRNCIRYLGKLMCR